MYENIVPILKYILSDLSFFDHCLIGDVDGTYEFMENKLQNLFRENKINIENNHLSIEEIIDNFETISFEHERKQEKKVMRSCK